MAKQPTPLAPQQEPLPKWAVHAALGFLIFLCLILAAFAGLVAFGAIPADRICAVYDVLRILVPICLAAGGAFIGGRATMNANIPAILGLPAQSVATITGSFVFFVVGMFVMVKVFDPVECRPALSVGHLSFKTDNAKLNILPASNIWISKTNLGEKQYEINVLPKNVVSGDITQIYFDWGHDAADETQAGEQGQTARESCKLELLQTAELAERKAHMHKTVHHRKRSKARKVVFTVDTNSADANSPDCEGLLAISGGRKNNRILGYIHYPIEGDDFALFEDTCWNNVKNPVCAAKAVDLGAMVPENPKRGGFWPFAAAYADERVTFDMALEQLGSEDIAVRSEARQALGARFTDPSIAKQSFEALGDEATAPRLKEGLLHSVIVGVQNKGPNWSSNDRMNLALPLPYVEGDHLDLTYRLLTDTDAGVRKQARRLVQRYPVNGFEAGMDRVIGAAKEGNCSEMGGTGELVYAAIFYRYNRLIRSAIQDVQSVDFESWKEAEQETIMAAQKCLTQNAAIDAYILTYGRALAESWKSAGDDNKQAKAVALKFLTDLGENREAYYKPRHVAQMLGLAELQVDEDGNLVPAN